MVWCKIREEWRIRKARAFTCSNRVREDLAEMVTYEKCLEEDEAHHHT